MLDLGPDANLRRIEKGSFNAAAGSADAGIIVLFRYDVAAVTEAVSFQNGLGDCQIRTDAFARGFFVVVTDKLRYGAIELRLGLRCKI